MTPKAKPLRWSTELPQSAGHWWMLEKDCDPHIVKVFKDPSYGWMVQYRDLEIDPDDEDACVNWVCNYDEGTRWAGPVCPPKQ